MHGATMRFIPDYVQIYVSISWLCLWPHILSFSRPGYPRPRILCLIACFIAPFVSVLYIGHFRMLWVFLILLLVYDFYCPYCFRDINFNT